MVEARLAIAKTFMESYSRLPKGHQKKVREFTDRFLTDPTSSSLNFERLPGMKDSKVRSLRVNQAYRVIVVQPQTGNMLLAVWVDNHDEAYRWAEKKTFEVNPVSGVMQVFSVEEGVEALKAVEDETPQVPDLGPSLFEAVDDEQLLLAGVPQPLLVAVRDLRYDRDLEALGPHLPADAADMLFLMASGCTFMEALDQASRPKAASVPVDTDDFETALASPVSQESFHIVEGEEELESILDAPLEQWRLFLHPSQRKIVEQNANGPVRVLGGAGTGKTVVLMHRARYLAEKLFKDDGERILVTTFTRNLALDIEDSIAGLCPESTGRIDVKNLHAWARSFYERHLGSRVQILDMQDDRRALMEEAALAAESERLGVPFYLEEWDQVVQAQGVTDRAGYLRVKRIGRGTPLARPQRAAVWAVFERYRFLLEDRGVLEWQDVIREAHAVLKESAGSPPFRAVLADEVQDFSPAELRLLRAMVPEGPADLFLVGDAHQRIYGNMANLGRCGIKIVGRSYRLRLNYRTTEQIRRHAVAVLENVDVDDMDEGIDSFAGYRSLRNGPSPQVHHFERPEQEASLIRDTIQLWLEQVDASSICIGARTNAAVERYSKMLGEAGIKSTRVKASAPSTQGGVRLATMHRMKGLEFKKVLLAGVQGGVMPLDLPEGTLADSAGEEDHEKRERCLFHVACTRARDELVITGFGLRSMFL